MEQRHPESNMSNTRRAKPGDPLSQERYASSFQVGLLANLVAKRCAKLRDRTTRDLIWFIQSLSWREDLTDLASEAFCDGEGSESEKKYFEDRLSRFCLDPRRDPGLERNAVKGYRDEWLRSLPAGIETEVTRKVGEALSFAKDERRMAIIDGVAGIGKSFAAREWCLRSGGIARFVEVPCSNDDMSFFRSIGQAIGVSTSLQLKAAEIRSRVQEALQGGDLMLVLDEAHYLWPQNWQRYAMPSRVNWIMTALVNANVAVALVTTPQFHAAQRRVEQLTIWNSEQFNGRIGHLQALPEQLGMKDMLAICRVMLPACDEDVCKAVADYSRRSQARLRALEAIAKRARWFASQDGRVAASGEDVVSVMRERASTFDNPGEQAPVVARLAVQPARDGKVSAMGRRIVRASPAALLYSQPR